MNPNVYRYLKALPEAEREAFLLKQGIPQAEIGDLLRWVAQALPLAEAKPKAEPVPFMQSEQCKAMEERLAAILAQNPVTPQEQEKSERERLFERDLLLNRYLFEHSSRYDDASLHHPNLVNTQVITWFREIFRTSHKQAALVIGDTGSGKTWGALAYMNSRTQVQMNGAKVAYSDSAFITAYRLFEMMSHPRRKHEADLDHLLRKRWLLIDDLGTEPSGYKGGDFIAYFDHMFSERHKFKRYTLITSNATVEQIKALYGERFVSRFNEVGSFLETTDKDLRNQAGV